ncbi:MAG: hypothetical protein ACTHMC_18245 [Pseudobacter sp.]|uniref:hypothetical protein n=1 Tax=Pseudobacter sp. TaxID=2045420 RepID=UPI003F7EB439
MPSENFKVRETAEQKLRKEFDAYLASLIERASGELEMKVMKPSPSAVNLLPAFNLYSGQQQPGVAASWIIQKSNHHFHLFCVDIDSTLKIYRSRETQTHSFLYGLVETKKDFGVSLLTRETLVDKFADIFIKADIDFNTHKKFSSRYRCFSNDNNKFTHAMSPQLMDFLAEIDHIELEFRNNFCLFRTEKSIIDHENNLALFSIGIGLSNILG